MTEIAIKKTSVQAKAITAATAVVSAVALPQIFHMIGKISGTGAVPGTMFLPMHLPVLLAALLGGPVVGVVTGALSPIISFLLSGMPTAALMPFMVIELAAYGLFGGLLSRTRMPVFAQLLLTQTGGRVVRFAAIFLAIHAFGVTSIKMDTFQSLVVMSIPGILLQWAFIPLLMYRMKGLKKYYD